MTKHLHYKTEYCWNCGNVAAGHCSKCGMPICAECDEMYYGKCDICIGEVSRAEGLSLGIGSMDNDYTDAEHKLYV